jgi:inner membrane transporter RhtA
MNSVFYLALRTIPLGIAVALEFTGPLAVAVMASRRKMDFLWVALAAAGLSVLLPITRSGAPLDWIGVFFALAAGVGWALYIIFGQRAGRAHGVAASTWGLIIAALLATPIGIVAAGSRLLSADVLPLGLGVAVFSGAFPYTLEMIALRRLSAKTFGTLMSFEPAIAAIAGVVILREHLSALQYLGIGAIIVASAGAVASESESEAKDTTRADYAA